MPRLSTALVARFTAPLLLRTSSPPLAGLAALQPRPVAAGVGGSSAAAWRSAQPPHPRRLAPVLPTAAALFASSFATRAAAEPASSSSPSPEKEPLADPPPASYAVRVDITPTPPRRASAKNPAAAAARKPRAAHAAAASRPPAPPASYAARLRALPRPDNPPPKRPRNAYAFFFSDYFQRAARDGRALGAAAERQLRDAPQEERSRVVAKLAAEAWRAMTVEEKDRTPSDLVLLRKRRRLRRGGDGPLARAAAVDRDPDAPRRPLAAYTLFVRDALAGRVGGGVVKIEDGTPQTERLRRVAEAWRGLGDAEKEPYHAQAAEERARYAVEKEKYEMRTGMTATRRELDREIGRVLAKHRAKRQPRTRRGGAAAAAARTKKKRVQAKRKATKTTKKKKKKSTATTTKKKSAGSGGKGGTRKASGRGASVKK
ncbi:hypothetical protein DFJ73DRAFT_960063 [Zopfochytrium polystomum]|nr:hypothetical protein DFJ73DRAFT_960063 [Zopfochytrium polystomum]